MKFDGKVVIVTGGGSGIGRASVEAFAAEGAKIAVVDRDEAMVRELTGAIGGAAGYVGDVSDAAQVAGHATTIATELGPPDVLVTAAGFSSGQALVETDESNWDDIFATNVKGTFLWMKAVLPGMRERGRGAVVTIASQLAFAGGQGNAAYIASKGAIVSLTATAAVEHARDGVRINSVAPGATATPLLERSMARAADPEAARERSRRRHAMGRLGRPEEIARAILYLASDDASFVTGVTLPVDGGWLAA